MTACLQCGHEINPKRQSTAKFCDRRCATTWHTALAKKRREEGRKMKSPEGYEKADIDKYLAKINAWVFCPYMAGYGKSGVPDRVCCIEGRFVSIEVKREGKEPTVLQARRIKEIQEHGGLAFWGTAEKVIREIEEWRQ